MPYPRRGRAPQEKATEVLASTVGGAEEPASPTDYYSADRSHVLHIVPDSAQPARAGWCLAELCKANGADWTQVWKRPLVTNAAPARAMVADGGRYVVTFGDGKQNDSFPVVIYGPQGDVRKLLTEDTRVPDMETHDDYACVLGDDFMNTLVYFGPGDTTLFIRLGGHLQGYRTIMVWLESGEVMDSEWFGYSEPGTAMSGKERDALEAFSNRRAAELTMECLQSSEARMRETGTMFAGRLRLREAILHLQQLLQDKAQELDPRKFNSRFAWGFGRVRIDSAQAARYALEQIAEAQKRDEIMTFVPPEADDIHGWLESLDRGQQARDMTPLASFLECWQAMHQSVAPNMLQAKPDFERAIYAMYPAFYLPELSTKTAKYIVVQDEIDVSLVDRDLVEDYRREAEGRGEMERRPVISQFTISDFRPSLQVDPMKVLYLDEYHVTLLARFLAGEHDRHLADSLWDVPNGLDERDFRGDDEGPFTRRLNYLNQSLDILPGHWGTGWHFATHPEIHSLVLNKDLKTAVIFFREGWGGGLALMQRDDHAWRVSGRVSTWCE